MWAGQEAGWAPGGDSGVNGRLLNSQIVSLDNRAGGAKPGPDISQGAKPFAWIVEQ